MSDSTEVGRIIAYLTLNRADWNAGVRDTERDARRLGSLSPSIRIEDNTGAVIARLALVREAERGIGQDADKAKPFVMNLWAALAAVAPAAVPIAAVAGGALLGLLPVAAAVSLGVKGIEADMKSGALAGTQYGRDINFVKNYLAQLKQTAASGLLDGVDQAIQGSRPLFGAINQDIGVFSHEIGDIVGGAAPALLTILHNLEPLFATIGNDVAKGATALEHWATSSDGVQKFVAYVQSELPEVEHLLGNLITLIAHLAEGAAPFGGVLLHDIDMFVGALDKIPVGVLQAAIPLVISLYAAVKTGQGVTAIVNGINAAIKSTGTALGYTGPAALAAAAEQKAAALQTQLAVAQEAESVAAAKAAEAEAFAAAQAEIYASVAGTGSVLEATALAAVAAADEEAAAFQAAAAAAAESAATIAASAEEAAAASTSAGEAASVGWSAMLGPAGAVIAGVGILAVTMLGASHNTQAAAEATNSYTDALVQSNGAITANLRSTIAKRLADEGLVATGQKLGLSINDLVDYTLGNAAAQDKVRGAIVGVNQAAIGALQSHHSLTNAQREAHTAAAQLYGGLNVEAKGLKGAAAAAEAQRQAAQGATAAVKSQAQAVADLDTQLEKLQQTELAEAQTQDQFLEAVRGVTAAVKQNGDSLSKHTAKGLANRDAFLSAVQAALSYKDAQEKAGVSVRRANVTLADNIAHLERTAIAAGLPKKAVHELVAQMDLVPHRIKTQFDIATQTAARNLALIKAQLAELPSYKTVTVNVAMRGNLAATTASQVPGRASGGGLPEGWAAVGERGPELAHKSGSTVQIYSHHASRAILATSGMRAPGFASGTPGSGSSNVVSQINTLISAIGQLPAAKQINLSTIGITQVLAQIHAAQAALNDAVAHGLSEKAAAPLSAAISNLAKQAQRELGQLKVKIDTSDVAALDRALAGTADNVRTAFAQLLTDAEHAGHLPKDLVASLRADNHELVGITNQANRIAQQLANAQTALAQAKQQRDQDAATAAQNLGQFDIGQAASVTDAGGSTSTSLDALIASLSAQVTTVQGLAGTLASLKQAGLDSGLLEQLDNPANAGLASQILAGGPAAVTQLDTLWAQLQAAAKAGGNTVGHAMDDAGVQAAQGLVNGLKSKEDDVRKEAEHIAHIIEQAIRKALKIHSPSQVAHELGVFTGQGLALGLNDARPLVLAASKDMASLTMPKLPGVGTQPVSALGGTIAELRALRAEVAALRGDVHDAADRNADTVTTGVGAAITTADRRQHIRQMTGSGQGGGLR